MLYLRQKFVEEQVRFVPLGTNVNLSANSFLIGKTRLMVLSTSYRVFLQRDAFPFPTEDIIPTGSSEAKAKRESEWLE